MGTVGEAEPRDAVEELERLSDWGRGSMTGCAEGAAWPLHRGWIVAAVAVQAVVPQALASFFSLVLWQQRFGMLLCSALLGGYIYATSMRVRLLPPRQLRLWLLTKTAGTAMMSIGLGAMVLAGPFGLVVAVPAGAVAAITAIGTLLLRNGHPAGAIPAVAIFSLLGDKCRNAHFSAVADTEAMHSVAIAAFAVAAITAVVAVQASFRATAT